MTPSWQPFSGAGQYADEPLPERAGSTVIVFLEPSDAG